MADNDLTLEFNELNGDPRVACVVLVDVSGSMSGAPINALNEGFREFCDYLQTDDLARKRAEVGVITFGSNASVVIPMQEGRTLEPVTFTINGSTNMADGIHLALDMIDERKRDFKAAGVSYFRPWLLVLTDGVPDPTGFEEAVARLNAVERKKGVTVFPVGVGGGVNYQTLARLTTDRDPAPLSGLKFTELFKWLSDSLTSVSHSNTAASDDTGVSTAGTVALPSHRGWVAV